MGGDVGAAAGTLSIMVGGSDAAIALALPLLEVMGKNIRHMGGPGAGQHTKMCNNESVFLEWGVTYLRHIFKPEALLPAGAGFALFLLRTSR